jgi:hypothetical protein
MFLAKLGPAFPTQIGLTPHSDESTWPMSRPMPMVVRVSPERRLTTSPVPFGISTVWYLLKSAGSSRVSQCALTSLAFTGNWISELAGIDLFSLTASGCSLARRVCSVRKYSFCNLTNALRVFVQPDFLVAGK